MTSVKSVTVAHLQFMDNFLEFLEGKFKTWLAQFANVVV